MNIYKARPKQPSRGDLDPGHMPGETQGDQITEGILLKRYSTEVRFRLTSWMILLKSLSFSPTESLIEQSTPKLPPERHCFFE